MLLLNSLLSLSISSLSANATLDEMYKEMKEIANETTLKEEVKSNIENLKEKSRLKLEIKEVKANIENLKEKSRLKSEIKEVKADIKNLKEKSRLKSEIKEVKADIENLKEKSRLKSEIKEVQAKIESVKVEAKKNLSKREVSPSVATIPVIAQIPITKTTGIHLSIPLPPKVPTVVSIGTAESIDRSIKFSKRVPPGYTGPKFGKDMVVSAPSKESKVGGVTAGKVSAYLRGELLEVGDVEKRLKDAGFTILTSAKLDKKGNLVSVVFTNKALISLSSKPNRGFASTLRVLVNKKEKQISITNPLYMLKGFLQEDFNKEVATKLLTAITSKFEDLKDSGDSLKFQLLPKYQFMHGLPYYQDTIVVAKGDNLLVKIKKNKRVFFEQKLDNGSVLIGVHLNKRTNGFLKKIGSKNAALLPMPVLIEDGKAIMLDPKYYISIMYPRLTMSEFMKIATIPDAMVKDSKRVFR